MAKLFIPNDLTRSQLDAFRSIEMELNKLASGGSLTTGTGIPTITSNLQDGSLYYDYTNLNLYAFNGTNWNLATTQLHIRYANSVTAPNQEGKVSSSSDVVGFSTQPFDADSNQLLWRGIWWGSAIASIDPTDYVWTYTSGAGAISVNIYSTNGNIFRNDTGTTVLRADVDIGGSLQSDLEHNSFEFKWTLGINVICVDSSGNIASDGMGNIYTDTTGLTCQMRNASFHRADTTDSTISLNFRQINLSADDIDNVKTIRCEVSNIP